MTDAYREASKYETAKRRELKRRRAATEETKAMSPEASPEAKGKDR